MNDWIKVGNVEGRVVGVTWRTTRVRTRDNDDVILPNGKISEETLINYYYPHPLHVEKIIVGADYKVPPYRVRRALLDSARRIPGVLEKPSPEVHVLNFGESAIDYDLEFWIDDVAERERIVSDVRERVWEEFKRSDINIPFPVRTLEILPRVRAAVRSSPVTRRTPGCSSPKARTGAVSSHSTAVRSSWVGRTCAGCH